MLFFQNETLKTLCLHARAEYPGECCGILLGKCFFGQKLVYQVIKTENTVCQKDSLDHFLIDPLEILKAETFADEAQLEIIGFYHSHPNMEAIPSNVDMLHMIAGYSYPILSVNRNLSVKVRSFEKAKQTDTHAKEEILIKERHNADSSICIRNIASLCKPKGEN